MALPADPRGRCSGSLVRLDRSRACLLADECGLGRGGRKALPAVSADAVLKEITREGGRRIEEIANAETLANAPARVFETTKDEAEKLGAIAFFGDKYGDRVRVLHSGGEARVTMATQ